ncbi:hypothetical protein V5O48_012946 [Marasmius crinis-equi]|uniref:F-box domain-containing protein n=1 Tax=Marasmius crinis-equi TaxID=585013 RepID=A0ABR3F1G1_9AGAR
MCGRCRESTKPRLPQVRPIESRFLRSSYVASDEEALSLISLLEEEKEGILWYKEEMARVRRWLQELEAGKQALRSNIQRRRSVLSAQRRMPAELWEIIFDMVSKPPNQDGYSLDMYYYSRHLSMIPVTLSHVCSRWRDIALGCPKLWSSIRLEFRDIPGHAHDVLRTFVRNAKGYPLQICMCTVGQGTSQRYPDQKCWEVLSEQFRRCSELVMESSDFHTFLKRVPVPRVAFANLAAFKAIARFGDDQLELEDWLIQALRCAPKLAKIQTTVVLPISSLPYPQLTEMKIERLDIAYFQDFIAALRVSTNLRTLDIVSLEGDTRDFDFVGASRSTVRLPSLQTLMIGTAVELQALGINDPYFVCLFTSLEMPLLHTLQLRYNEPWWDSGVPWPPSLLSMLSHASSSLRRLTMCLDAFEGTQQPLSVVLQTVPNLVCFTLQVIPTTNQDDEIDPPLDVIDIDEYISSFLSDLTSQKNLMPNLNTLFFRFRDLSLKNLDILGRMLELAKARSPSMVTNTPGLRALTNLRLECFRWENGLFPEPVLGSVEEMETVEALRREGVSFDMKDVEGDISLAEEADRLWM